MMKVEILHKQSHARPPNRSFGIKLPGQVAECRAALTCGLGRYSEETWHTADTAVGEYLRSDSWK